LRARGDRPSGSRTADKRDEFAASIKKTRSHGTIAKRVDLGKRPKSAKALPFSSSRVGRRPVGNSFEHLIRAGKQHWWDCPTKRLSGEDIEHQLKSSRLLDRQFGRSCALEDAVDVVGDSPYPFGVVDAQGQQSAGLGKGYIIRDHWQLRIPREANDLDPIAREDGLDNDCLHAVTLHRLKVRFIESIRAINKSHQNVQTDLVRSCLCLASEGGSIGVLRRTKEGDGADARSDLTQDFETLPGKIGSRVGDAGEVSAGMRQALDR